MEQTKKEKLIERLSARTDMDEIFMDIWEYLAPDYPVQIFIGCRGMGKTYSALRGAHKHALQGKGRYIYMRRTSDQLDAITDGKTGEGLNPFKPLNQDYQMDVGLHYVRKKVAIISDRYLNSKGQTVYEGDYGYGLGMSGIATLRGIDASDCIDWIYDEFIKEKHQNRMQGEFDAIMNAYETFNRNREILGRPPLRLWMLSNSNDIYNEMFKGLHLVHDAEVMVRKGHHHKYYKDRGLALHILEATKEYIQEKENTALYRLTKGTDFADMALRNRFAYNDFSLIKYLPLQGYQPVCHVDDGYLYRKKGEGKFYVCYAPAKCEGFNSKLPHDTMNFRRSYGAMLADRYARGDITFESYELKELFLGLIL